ncbi:hypothetical protein YC2023_119953 [Brassica napus]
MEHTGKSSISTDRKTSEKTVDSSASVKPNGKSIDASVTVMKPNEKAAVSRTSVSAESFSLGVESGSSGSSGDTAGDRARKASEILEADEAKRPKSG